MKKQQWMVAAGAICWLVMASTAMAQAPDGNSPPPPPSHSGALPPPPPPGEAPPPPPPGGGGSDAMHEDGRPPRSLEEEKARLQKKMDHLNQMTPEEWSQRQQKRMEMHEKWDRMPQEEREKIKERRMNKGKAE